MSESPVVLFDGVCNLCNGLVNFVIDRDPLGRVHFASLQSEAGQRLLTKFNLPASELSTMVLIEGDRASTRSTAALRVVRYLAGLWPLLYVFIVVPPPVRNLAYGIVARRRYRWFGQRETCRVPTPGLQQRFL